MASRIMWLGVALLPAALARSAISDAKSPISKVVTLITEMKDQCAKDGTADAEAYDKYKCWCVTTEEEKKTAIAAAQQKLEDLNGFLEEAAAKSAELKTEIAGLKADIAKDQDALASATSMREKENKEFLAEEADAKETLGLLAEAISVLSNVQLLQKQKGSAPHQAALVQVRNIVSHIAPKFGNVMQKDLYAMLGSFEEVEQKHLGALFLPKNRAAALEQSWKRSLPWAERAKSEEAIGKDSNPNEMQGAAAGAKSYNAKSGGILGLLKQMGDQTAADLASSQKEELSALAAFQTLNAAKMGEIAAATEQKDSKTVELADLTDKMAKAKEDVESTSAALAADQEYLSRTQDGCAVEDQEYAKRVKVRNDEIIALGETLDILTGDEARSLFDKTISFIQVGTVSASQAHMQERAKNTAMQRILAAAKKSQNWALASLAVQVRLDAFGKVKVAMDKMLGELKAQQKAEYEKWEECKKSIDETEDKIKEAQNTKEDLDSRHSELSNTLETLASEISGLKKEVADMEVALKQAGEQRKADNGLYQQSMSDQRATIAILNMAAARLKKFYTPGAELVQVHLHAPPPPKSSSNAYEKSENSGGVMQLLAKIVSDAEAAEAELGLDENHAQKNYAAFVSQTTASIEADRTSLAQKEEQSAEAKGEKSETEESSLANDGSLTELNGLLTATHGQCDYVLNYFDLRQKSRQEEMDAIGEAKAILSGANFA